MSGRDPFQATDLHRARGRMEMTQASMAEHLGVTRSAFSHWENSRAPVPEWVADRVKKADRLHHRVAMALWGEA